MTGGGGLNVLTNTLLTQLSLPSSSSSEKEEAGSEDCLSGSNGFDDDDNNNDNNNNLLIYAPSAPNDCGLGMGLIWSLTPPPSLPLPSSSSSLSPSLSLLEKMNSELTYAGFSLWDGFFLEEIALLLGAKVIYFFGVFF